MTNEKLNRLLLILNAIRIGLFASIPTDEMGVTSAEREASDVHAAAALAPLGGVGVGAPTLPC